MSDHHHAWLVEWPSGARRFATLRAALRYRAHHEPWLGPPVLIGLVPR